MAEYDNTNRGLIGKNKDKTLDTHPDIKGSINVEGVEYWLDGWQKTNSKDGSKFYSLRVKPKQARQETASGNSYAQVSSGVKPTGENKWSAGLADLDDDLPF